MRMTNFFLKFEYGSLRDCSGGHKHKKNLTYHSPQRARAFWVIFAHFCAFNFYFPLFLKNDLTFSYEILKRFSWCYSEGHYTHTQKRNSQHSPLCRVSFWGILWLISMYVFMFRENRSVFSHEILCRCYWYISDVHYYKKKLSCRLLLCWDPFWYMFLYFLLLC